jgi:hypothetical protein
MGLAHAGHNTLDIYEREFKEVSGIDVELCVHPGINTPSLEKKYAGWKFDWSGERDALLDPRFAEMLKQRGYEFAQLHLLPATASA